MIHKFSRLLMTLVALFAMTTGAWAQEETLLTTILSTGDNASFKSGSKTFDNIATVTFSGTVYNEGGEGGWSSFQGFTLTVTAAEGYTITRVKFYNMSGSAFDEGTPFEAILTLDDDQEDITKVNNTSIGRGGVTKIEVYGYADTPAGPEVTWDAATKTGTFTMPASDVVLTPEFAPVAQWATESDVELLPTAAEGIFAGTTDPIIVEGTVAPGQGIVMYAVTSTNQATAPELSAFSATVPTAENIADEGADVLVWYYIQGADTPDGQEATAENTFNDSEICATPLEVSVLSNQFDITLNAANANTIEGQNGKGTVTVKTGDADAVDKTADIDADHKLKAVKMGSEVKVKANTGYKFRKVEVEKNDGSTRLDKSTVGMIVCTNGKAYPVNMKDNLPSGVTAVGIVAYKNGKNGLVMALTDEATNMNWGNANGDNGAKAHTPTVEGYSWKVPTIYEWQYNLFTDAGVGNLAGLSTYMTAAGGTGLQNGCYWTSTPKNNSYYARCIKIENGSINFGPGGDTELKSNSYHVRAVFTF